MSDQLKARLKQQLAQIVALDYPEKLRIMNVCGGHERTITRSGLRSILPQQIELIPGPGCPVCICPEEDINEAIQLAMNEDIILTSFGDMLRVPINVPQSQVRSLEQARAKGAQVMPIASPLEVITIAKTHPNKQVVFFAVGFETTMAPVAAMLAEGIPDNLSLLISGRKTWPAVAMLLDSGKARFDALIAPGHVAAVMGANEWGFVSNLHQLPTAIAGFTAASMIEAISLILQQHQDGVTKLDNAYQAVVKPDGNPDAIQLLHQVFNIVDAKWRGIGIIKKSGFALNSTYNAHDARLRFNTTSLSSHPVAEMPAGCDCSAVILGQSSPDNCKLYGKTCTPQQPIGPCMVSDEGACRIWWNGGIRDHVPATH